jgi:methionine synthase II (cobalamin-independent)
MNRDTTTGGGGPRSADEQRQPERILTYVDIVGPDRVIAGTDCGFGTWAGFGAIDPDICWAKMQSLSQGAEIASSLSDRSVLPPSFGSYSG